MWKILTEDGIYCDHLKWICSSKEKYYKSRDEYLDFQILCALNLSKLILVIET